MDLTRRLRHDHTWKLHGRLRDARHVVLVLHGGAEQSTLPTLTIDPAYLRMTDLVHGLRRRQDSTVVYRLQHRVQGWNSSTVDAADPVLDAREALAQIRRRHPLAPIVLLGHSMGGRTAFAVADSPGVVGVCSLAPWLPDDEPLPRDLTNRRFVLAHGTGDIITSPVASRRYARRLRAAGADVAMFHQTGGMHSLARAPHVWHRFAVGVTLGLVGDQPLPAGVADALRSPDGLTRPLHTYDRHP